MKRITSFCNGSYLANTLRRHWWLGFINFVVMFFAMPLAVLLRMDGDGWTAEGMDRICRETFGCAEHGGYMTLHMFMAMALGFLAGMVLLCYMHDRRQVNFYHAQPIRRERLILTRLGAALVLFVIPLAANALLTVTTVAVTSRLVGLSSIPLGGYAVRLGLITASFLLLLAFTALAGVISGTAFAHLEMTALLLGLPIAVYALFHLVMDVCYATYVSPLSDMFTDIEGTGAPISMLCPPLYMLIASGSDVLTPLWMGLLICLTAGLLALSVVLYRLRASEGAHMPLVFPATVPIVRLAACAVLAMGMGLFFYALTEGVVMGFLGGILGGLLCHMFCQVQFRKDFRAMFRGMGSAAALLAVLAAVTVCMGMDVTGYDRYIPNREDIASVSLVTDNDEFGPLYYGGSYMQARYDHADTASEEIIDGVQTLLGEVYALADRGVGWGDTLDLGTLDGEWIDLRLRWTMENGRQVYRNLYLAGVPEEIADAVEMLQNEPVYLEKHHVFAIPEDVEILDVRFNNVLWGGSRSDMPPAEAKMLVRALRQDIAEKGVYRDDMVLGELWVTCVDEERLYDVYLPVRESYEGTKTVLRDRGWLKDTAYPEEFTRGIESLRIYRFSDSRWPADSVLLTDRETIDEAVQAARPEEYIWSSGAASEKEYAFVLEVRVDDDGSYTVTPDNAAFPDGEEWGREPVLVIGTEEITAENAAYIAAYMDKESVTAESVPYYGDKEEETVYRCTFRFPRGQVPDAVMAAFGA